MTKTELYTIEVKRFFDPPVGSNEEFVPETYKELLWIMNREQIIYWLTHKFYDPDYKGNIIEERIKSLGNNGSVIASMHEYFVSKYLI